MSHLLSHRRATELASHRKENSAAFSRPAPVSPAATPRGATRRRKRTAQRGTLTLSPPHLAGRGLESISRDQGSGAAFKDKASAPRPPPHRERPSAPRTHSRDDRSTPRTHQTRTNPAVRTHHEGVHAPNGTGATDGGARAAPPPTTPDVATTAVAKVHFGFTFVQQPADGSRDHSRALR